ncbi:hypothetical protein CLOL250_02584 [Clostridium sp. L2-50]|nr:hypothetical protein CLOL250_02584 [Clostridium sp. L2-50]
MVHDTVHRRKGHNNIDANACNIKHAPPHCCMVERVCFEINDLF